MTLQATDLIALRDIAAQRLTRFLDPARTGERLVDTIELRPRDDDYERVFVADSAANARAVYDRLWANITPIVGKPGQSVVLTWICLSDRLSTAAGRRFPGGYQKIIERLMPGVPWVCWKFAMPGRMHGVAYDGLVRIDDRWAWFPKPWKMLMSKVSALSYLTD